MEKKTTFSSTIKNRWNKNKNYSTRKNNIKNIIKYIFAAIIVLLGAIYNTIHSKMITTMLISFMITVEIFTAALFVVSLQYLQAQKEMQEGGDLYTTDENIVIEKLRTMIDYSISMGFITVIFIGVNIVFDINNAPLWVVFSSLIIIGLLVADFLITMLKIVRLVRVVNRIMML